MSSTSTPRSAPPSEDPRLTQLLLAFAAIYFIGSITLGFHLSHGFRSAFQSLGANHPRLNVIAGRIGLLLSILIGAGFASFPIVFLMIG